MLERNSWITGILLMSLIVHADAKANEHAATEAIQPAATVIAKQVVAEAAEKAIESLRDETRLELDIRLLSPTSIESANDS